MKIFTKKEESQRDIAPRIKKLNTNELVSWADTTIMLIGRSFDDYRYRDEPLEETGVAVKLLSDILYELQNRK